MKIGIPVSISVIFWGIISFARAIIERFFAKHPRVSPITIRHKLQRVAFCLAAHNEEKIIGASIDSIKKLTNSAHIYVISDGSTDSTVRIIRRKRCNILENKHAQGKAKALKSLMEKFKLLDTYEFIAIVDADTLLDRQYLKRALQVFIADKQVAALAAYAVPIWQHKFRLSKADFIAAYRTKLYQILQMLLMYGQTWKYFNVSPVIPGFASMYRTTTLKKLDLVVRGIWIEDFNLAFQIHKKKLGKIAYYPKIKAYYHDPRTLGDYVNQVSRWNVGFYQTVRKQGVWPSLFWFSTGLFTAEVLLSAFLTLLLPILASAIEVINVTVNPASFTPLTRTVMHNILDVWEILLSLALIDYGLTVFIAVKDRKPMLLVYGLGFYLFQFLNSYILVASLAKGLFTESAGTWKPVKR